MNTKSTDIDRHFKDLPDDPQATKERLIMFFTCTAMGIVFGILGTMAYFNLTDQPCSAQPYCSVHKVK